MKVEHLSPFLRRRVETEADVRDRIARAIERVDGPYASYEQLAEAAMDAMEADR